MDAGVLGYEVSFGYVPGYFEATTHLPLVNTGQLPD